MNLQGKDRVFDTERDDKMSRKSDAIKDRKFNSSADEELDNVRNGSYQSQEHSVEPYDEEETVDISDFGRLYASSQIEAESEEAKKVAELMASISSSESEMKPAKTKKRKNKIKKNKKDKNGFGSVGADKDVADEPSDKADSESSDMTDEQADNIEYIAMPTDELDRDFYEGNDSYSENIAVSDNEVEFDESIDVDFDDTYAHNEDFDNGAYEEIDEDFEELEEVESVDDLEEVNDFDEAEEDFDDSPTEPEYEDYIETQPSEEIQSDDVSAENDDVIEEDKENDEKPSDKRTLIQKLKDFWYGAEDFEEKFDDDFDPSVFDDAQPEKADTADEEEVEYDEESEIIDSDNEEAEAYEESEINDSDNEEVEVYEESEVNDSEDEEAEAYDEENLDSDDEYDEDEDQHEAESGKKGVSLLSRIRAFWNGDDIKNKNMDDEEVSDEEIEAEVEAEKSEWISHSVKYDDLSEYAPKERTKNEETLDYTENLDDEDFEMSGKTGLFAFVKDKVNSFLRPSLGAEDEDEQDDEQPEDNTEIEQENPDDSEPIELEDEKAEKAEKGKISSSIQQIKKFWNADGEYADEDEEDEEDDNESDAAIDAEFNDEEEQPVVVKPVLTVIDPSKTVADDEQDDEQDVEDLNEDDTADTEEDFADDELQDAEETEESEVTADSADIEDIEADSDVAVAETQQAIDDIAEEEIISEGPDTPVDVVIKVDEKKNIGILSRIKSFWNGGTLSGEDVIEDKQSGKNPSKSKKKAHFGDKKKADSKADMAESIKAAITEEKPLAKPTEKPIEEVTENPAQRAEAVEEIAVDAIHENEQTSNLETTSENIPDAATFEDVAKESFAMNEVDGRQVVNGRVVPKYTHESLINKISLTNENLPLVVRREYEEYIRQAKYRPKADDIPPQVNSEVSKAVQEEMNKSFMPDEPKQSEDVKENIQGKDEKQQNKQEPKPEKRSVKDVLFGNIENSADFSEFRAQTNLNPQNDQVVEDYDKPSDARAIRAEINYDSRKVSFRCITLSIIFLITLVLYIVQRSFTTVLTHNMTNADIMTCLVSLLLLVVSAVLCHSTVIGGLKPLLAFKGNSDTAVAVAVLACAVQGAASLVEPQLFFNGGAHLYAILAIAALLLNNLGKLCIVKRIKDNFKFVASPNRKYAARIFEDEEISKQMIDKTEAEKPVVALQSRTRFLKGFLRFSYMPDPSERMASFIAPITTVIAVLIAIICGITNGSVLSSISSFALVACMGIPMCCLLAVNIPIKKLCSEALKNRAMIIGYPAVKNFSETRAIMVDSRELYPRGKVQLLSVKTFNTYNIDKALLNAAAVMKVANTPMTYMFEDVISEKGEQLPEVESVKYEDGMGIVSWVGGERLLLGNRELMSKYSINLPSLDFEESSVESRTNCITYLANAGQLVAMLVTDYQADHRLAAELKRLENNGVTILIRTADPNVSQLKVAKDFGTYIRSIKILPTELGNICKDEMSKREDNSRAFVSTEGKLHSFARAIGGCIKIKDNISIAIVIQVIAVVLGVLIAGVVSVFAGLNGLNGLDLLLYVIFWAAASIIAPMIQKA